MRHLMLAAAAALLLSGCDRLSQVAASPAPSAPSVHAFEYRVVSINREIEEYRSLGTKSVTINGNIEFTQRGTGPLGNYMLIGKLRIEGAGETNERDLFILIERGRGQYEGLIFSDFSMPRDDPSPEIRPDQIAVTVTGVVPLQAAELSRLADSVSQTNAAQTPAQPSH